YTTLFRSKLRPKDCSSSFDIVVVEAGSSLGFVNPLISREKRKPTSSTIPATITICFMRGVFILKLGVCFGFLGRVFHFVNKYFCWLKAWYEMLRNNNRCIFRDVPSSFLSSLFYHEATKTPYINIFAINHVVFDYFEKCFYRFLNVNFLNSCLC